MLKIGAALIAGLVAMGGWAVVTVKEGLNLPRYPSVPGRLRAKSKPVDANAMPIA